MTTNTNIHDDESDAIRTDRSRDAEYFRLNSECMRECGVGAALTLAAFYRIAGRGKFFRTLSVIMKRTRFSDSSTKRHMKVLEDCGWIENFGRQRRRTPTRAITDRVLDGANDWAMVLPEWVLDLDLKESELALISISFHRVRGMSNSENGDLGAWLCIDASAEFTWSTKWVASLTGLSPKSIRSARASLVARGMIEDSDQPRGKIVVVPRTPDDCDDEHDEIQLFSSSEFPGHADFQPGKSATWLGEIRDSARENLTLGLGKSDTRSECKDPRIRKTCESKDPLNQRGVFTPDAFLRDPESRLAPVKKKSHKSPVERHRIGME
ncbi:hypothetical protein Enr13x_32750 [Stieleria neptunia]|uniref:Uncharacterized protein n=1 Tax=Stieleria neptunia TaxID=2527979 RepID=A0A518HRE5_9BACT|nr:hypothetical protein [Stieleria neptunia]QDV43419.1 hypothetical protein Enr13x_32750 [Stieleria neptunia]